MGGFVLIPGVGVKSEMQTVFLFFSVGGNHTGVRINQVFKEAVFFHTHDH